ncbi:MAG: hypothetical protein Q9181_000865 [Wetmoreana brouardii]
MIFGKGIVILASLCITVVLSSLDDPALAKENYLTSGCGDKTDSVVQLIQQLRNGLQIACETDDETIVYQKFFKGVSSIVVKELLSQIIAGSLIPNNDQLMKPTIVCVNPKLSYLCRDPRVVATCHPGTQYVYLCPRFMDLKTSPDGSNCLDTLANNHNSTVQALARTQLTVLLHELVDIYLSSRSGFSPLEPEVNGLSAVLALPSTQSAVNPANYVFYVANIMAKCTKFDLSRSFRPPERNLVTDDELPTTPGCGDDPLLAEFGECPDVKASSTFTVVPRATSGSSGSSVTSTETPTA